jgi:hypothetical protein
MKVLKPGGEVRASYLALRDPEVLEFIVDLLRKEFKGTILKRLNLPNNCTIKKGA